MENTLTQQDEILASLEEVLDPELGVDIVSLGLIYQLEQTETGLTIQMTLTTPACPLTDILTEEINTSLNWLNQNITIEWVWTPAWHTSRITDSGREQLRALGMNI